MKTRNDFVSNSSSCSFVIKDVAAGLDALKEIGILECNDMDSIYAMFTLDEHVFTALNMPRLESWRDDRTHEVFCQCTPYELLQLPALALENFASLEFQCDDYERNAVFILSLMYEALRTNGIDVSNDSSEIDFPSADSSKCAVAKLLNYIIHKRKPI